MKKIIVKGTTMTTGIVADFLRGAKYPFRAFFLYFFRPKYWKYAAVPVILALVIYSLLFFVMIKYLMPFLIGLLPQTGHWNVIWVYLYETFLWLMKIAFFLLTLVIVLLTFTMFFCVIASPFLDMMSIRIEKDRYNFNFDEGDWKQMARDILMAAKNSLWLNLVSLFWMIICLPLNFFVPVVGFLPGFLFASYFFGSSFLIYSAEHRRIHRREFGRKFRSKRWLILGFGVVNYTILTIPFVSVLLLPVAVAGGTMMFNEQFSEELEHLENSAFGKSKPKALASDPNADQETPEAVEDKCSKPAETVEKAGEDG